MLGNFGSLNAWEVEGFVQEWLFFGLLSEVLQITGVPLRLQDFVGTGQQDEPIITTGCLPDYLQKWAENEVSNTLDVKRDHAQQVNGLFKEAKAIITRLYRKASNYVPMGPGGCIVIMLGETLQHAAIEIYQDLLADRANFWYRSVWPSRRMLTDGWCPNRVSMLEQLLTSSAMYFASSMGGVETASAKHATCVEDRCMVHHLDRETYRSKHLCDKGLCNFIGSEAEDIGAAVESGGIPLLRLIESPLHNDVHVEVVRSDLKTPPKYVAISHVWSDGRGNLGSNTLPTCQLLHLNSQVSKLYSTSSESTLFWIDTICVPAKGDSRRVAIGRMRKTYEQAEKVLVLDSGLESASMNTFPAELLMRIACSGWMRRLWTFQEGVLAQQLIFQFREQAVDFASLETDLEKDGKRGHDLIATDASNCSSHLQTFRNLKSDQILELVEALQWRDTSWKSDEPVCMSSLLDMDTELIERTEPEQRMSVFLSMVKYFPAYLIFIPGPRLQIEKFCWAPASLIPHCGFGLYKSPQDSLAMQSTLGLILKLPGLILPKIDKPLRDLAWFKIRGDPGLYRLINLGAREDGSVSWSELGPHNIESPVVLRSGLLFEGHDADFGVLVSIHFEDEKVISADFVGRVFLSRENGEIPQEVLQRMIQQESFKSGETAWLGTAEHMITDRKWCIS